MAMDMRVNSRNFLLIFASWITLTAIFYLVSFALLSKIMNDDLAEGFAYGVAMFAPWCLLIAIMERIEDRKKWKKSSQ